MIAALTLVMASLAGPMDDSARLRLGRPDVHGWAAVYLASQVTNINEEKRKDMQDVFIEETLNSGIDPILVLAIIATESSFNAKAISIANCRGLMQLSRPTALWMADLEGLGRVDEFDPTHNIRIGIRYLLRILKSFKNLELSLMAYNVGPTAIGEAYAKKSILSEHRVYPARVKSFYKKFRLYHAFDKVTFQESD